MTKTLSSNVNARVRRQKASPAELSEADLLALEDKYCSHGDTVHYTLKVTAKRQSASIPGWGLLFNTIEATNQRGELVYHAELVGFSKLRDYRMPLRLRLVMALTRIPVLGKLLASANR